MKTCTSGDDCRHDDGPDLPESEFYGNSKGGTFVKCKRCCCAKNSAYYQANKTKSVKDIIAHLKGIEKPYWHGVITDTTLVGKSGSDKHQKVFNWMISQ